VVQGVGDAMRNSRRDETRLGDDMPTGRVTYYTEDRGFGFIKPDDGGSDVFVHANYLTNADALTRDQLVSFEIVNDDRRGKPRARSGEGDLMANTTHNDFATTDVGAEAVATSQAGCSCGVLIREHLEMIDVAVQARWW
jgi:CspA family cold shock protein